LSAIRKTNSPPYGHHGHYDLGTVAQGVGRYRRAIAEYRKEIRLTNYYKAHYNLGTILSQKERYAEAIEAYKAALRQRPNLGDAYNNLGIIYTRRRQYRKAIEALSRAVRADPRDPVYHFNLGFACVSAHEDGKAIAAFRRTLRLAPLHLDAMKNLGFLLIEEGTAPAKGVHVLQKALRISPRDPEILADLATGYLKQRRLASAEKLARLARRLAPRNQYVLRVFRRVRRAAQTPSNARQPASGRS